MKKNIYTLIISLLIISILVYVLFWLTSQKDKINPITNNNSITQIPNNVVYPSEQLIIDTWSVSSPEVDNQQIDNDIKKAEEKKTLEIKILNTINNVWQSWNQDSCEDINEENEKIKCLNNSYAVKASIDNNPALCSKIVDSDWQDRCLNNYYNENAIKSSNYNLCTKITDEILKENCNSNVIFQKIESPDFNWWIEICDVLNWENKSICQSKFNKQSDWEILQYAVNNLDIKSCEKISDSNFKYKCQNVINFKIAINAKDLNKCSLIIDDILKTKCISVLNNY